MSKRCTITIVLLTITIISFAQEYEQTNLNLFPNKNMVLIPAGSFEMGITTEDLKELAEMGKKVPHMNLRHAEGWYGDERPKHTVFVNSFYMDKYEVTNLQFSKFVEETGYEAEGDWKKYAQPGRKLHPVVCVTWNDANAYAKWAGKRLPTEEEWEYAAKGGLKVKWFPWGDKPDPSKANYRTQGESFLDGTIRLFLGRNVLTEPVGSYKPNGFGLFDMCGNVNEWCEDYYQPYPGLNEASWKYSQRRPFKETGIPDNRKISRGGNWDSSNPVFIRLNKRTGMDPNYVSYTQGFRCAKSIE
jgi:formylglycine-generating enzyme required for sulfatase activity